MEFSRRKLTQNQNLPSFFRWSKRLEVRQHDVVLNKWSLPQRAAVVEHVGMPVEESVEICSVRLEEAVSDSLPLDSRLSHTSPRGLSEEHSSSCVPFQVQTIEVVVMDNAVLHQPATNHGGCFAPSANHG
jgi:hypothetical protein